MYSDFAAVYDKLQDADYKKFVDYYEEIFKKFGKNPKLVLDLACGTGNITLEMAKRGYDMIGLDLSCEMLNIAREKFYEENLDILLLNQDMREFELFGTVDAIVCALDGINYITEKEDLKQVFRLAKNYLNPDGIMIFDINSEYKLKEVLGKETFVNEEDGIFYVWQSYFDEQQNLCEFNLNFFCRQADGSYKRFDETQVERAYKEEEISDAVKGAGLDVYGIYKPFEFATATDKDERIFFVISPKNVLT